MPSIQRQRLYCYVDEAGQDSASGIFVVVAVVSDREQEQLRESLTALERIAKTGGHKWHKTRPSHRLRYLALALERKVCAGEVFFGTYPKEIPYFVPMIDAIEYAINEKAVAPYQARVFIDGIDRKKATELTNALRVRGISLQLVQSRCDESEPAIRLADMWAGCARAAALGKSDEREVLKRAEETGYLRRKQKPL
jgi:hypothetical protein